MSNLTTLPFGPQHPVLPEPLQFKLEMEDERIVEAIPAIGYVHRGLERLIQCARLYADDLCGGARVRVFAA